MLIKELIDIRYNTKGVILLFLFRISSYCTRFKLLKILFFPIRFFYKFFVQWVLGVDIPDSTKIGYAFNIFHGQGIVIHENVVIGKFCSVRQNTTIGVKDNNPNAPIIGDNVSIGANVCIIGDLKIGNNAIIGAGTVVVKDVPENAIVVGNPARILKK